MEKSEDIKENKDELNEEDVDKLKESREDLAKVNINPEKYGKSVKFDIGEVSAFINH